MKVCPDNYYPADPGSTQCYRLIETPMYLHEAQQECMKSDGFLAEFDSLVANDKIANFFSCNQTVGDASEAWIGLKLAESKCQ